MARTKKGSKGSGYDFWSRRPHSSNGHGRIVKTFCHRVERRQAADEVRRALDDL